MKKTFVLSLVMILVFGLNNLVLAQKAIEPKASPMALAKVNLENTYVSVTYSQPHKRGRVIFGELVPFGKIWRFGANEATQFTTTGDIQVGDQTVKAGTYSVFCIPEKDSWTLIFNTDLGQWGAYQYNPEKDVVKVSVPTAATSEIWEPFTIRFTKPDGKSTTMMVMWDETMISVPIKAL